MKELFFKIINEIIDFYILKNWNLSHYFSLELSLSLCYFVDSSFDIKEFFIKFVHFNEVNYNYQTLLILTQFEEFFLYAKNE